MTATRQKHSEIVETEDINDGEGEPKARWDGKKWHFKEEQ